MIYKEAIKELLVTEFLHTPEDADRLIKEYTDVMVEAIISGPRSYRSVCMALEMRDKQKEKE